MKIALWIIAVCEVGRLLQNFVQIRTIQRNANGYDKACDEFVKSLSKTDAEILEAVLDEYHKRTVADDERADS